MTMAFSHLLEPSVRSGSVNRKPSSLAGILPAWNPSAGELKGANPAKRVLGFSPESSRLTVHQAVHGLRVVGAFSCKDLLLRRWHLARAWQARNGRDRHHRSRHGTTGGDAAVCLPCAPKGRA